MDCKYCKNSFSTKTSLNNHQRTAKYCLKLQNKPQEYKFICDSCGATFHKVFNLDRHTEKCKDKIYEYASKVKILEKTNEKSDVIISTKDQIISKLESRIKELEDQLFSITREAVARPTHVQNNNQRINQVINNLSPITDQLLQDQAKNLTIEHIKDGAAGYAKYALEYPLKDRVVCVDFSRRKIKYKNADGELIADPEMVKLSQKLFSAIDEHNTKLINEYLEELKEKLFSANLNGNNDMDEEETIQFQNDTNLLIDSISAISSQKREVKEIASGMKPDIYHDFIKNVCSSAVI